MLGSLAGLSTALVVLIPGYIHYAIRRRLVPKRKLSPAMETMGLVAVATVANATTLAVMGLIMSLPWLRDHAPDLAHLLRDPTGYILLNNSRLAYVALWTMLLIALASLLAAALAYSRGPFGNLSGRLTPAIADESTWYSVFDTKAPDDILAIYVMCELDDGSYTAGDLAWYNTDPDDSPDRDLVLAPPFDIRVDGNKVDISKEVERLVISARNIRRMYVAYVT